MDVHDKLEELVALVEGARSMPMSSSAIVNRAELLTLLDEVRDHLPEEIDHARTLLEDRDAVVADGRRQAEGLVDKARAERARLVSETAVLQQAQREAEELTAESLAEAERMRRETDDYVDAKLEDFEVLLDRTLTSVARGRDKLRERGTPGPRGADSPPTGGTGADEAAVRPV